MKRPTRSQRWLVGADARETTSERTIALYNRSPQAADHQLNAERACPEPSRAAPLAAGSFKTFGIDAAWRLRHLSEGIATAVAATRRSR